MTTNLDSRKYKIITQITDIQDEDEILELERYIEQLSQKRLLDELTKPMKKSISIEALIVEQNYEGVDKDKFENLIEELDIQEPIEDLLKMLN